MVISGKLRMSNTKMKVRTSADKRITIVLMCRPAMGPGILLKAFSERWLRLSVNSLTGELHLGEANAVVGSRLESKLAQASKIASFSPVKLMDNLLMMRSLVR